jgi:dihydropteroate synthase
MRIYRVSKPKDRKRYLNILGVDRGGIDIIVRKMELLFIRIEGLKSSGANILKQESLSLGAELAVPTETVTCKREFVDALLIANRSQINLLSKKCLSQPFGLKEVAKKLKELMVDKRYPLKIMGVINVNGDSFYSGSRFSSQKAIERVEEMIDEGVDIIDVGAVSSRPGSVEVSLREELDRVKPICDVINRRALYKRVLFSIDSYRPEVISYALDSGFGFINDITGASDDRVISLAKEYKSKLCIMHMQGRPKTMQIDPKYESVIDEIDTFFEERLERSQELGLERESIVLDVGIGFGKKLEHNLELLREHSHFLRFGCELLIGASRKSMIDMITPSKVEDRLPGTVAIHLKAFENGANIIRCHDTKEHIQAFKVWRAIEALKPSS